jgi:hypothetical protein
MSPLASHGFLLVDVSYSGCCATHVIDKNVGGGECYWCKKWCMVYIEKLVCIKKIMCMKSLCERLMETKKIHKKACWVGLDKLSL